jgi:potassium efflux system protein
MAILIAAVYLFNRVMDRARETPRGSPREPYGSWMDRLRKIGYPLAVGIPLFLAALSAAGYYFTAVRLLSYTHSSFWLLMGAAVVHELAVRWLAASSAAKGGEERPAVAGKRDPETSSPAAPTPAVPKGDGIYFSSEGKQARQLLDALIGLGMVIGLLFIWADIFPVLSSLKQVHFWSQTATIGGKEIQEPVSLYHLIAALVLTALFVVLARSLPSILEIALLRRLPISAASRYAAITLTRYSIALIGVIVLFNVLGGSWSKIQWLVAAMGVGLGFGLQEIVANFICGVIVLFEQPIRLGDTVTIGAVSGKVSRIHMRATIVTDWDNKEVIIPNKSLITGQIVNWTLTEPVTRHSIRVSIAYGSDTALAHRVILDTVKAHPVVMAQPEPKVLFLGFGESSLDFTAYFFVHQVADRLQVTHDLHLAIERALREYGITIPFPQREIHIRSAAPAAWPDTGPERKTGPE